MEGVRGERPDLHPMSRRLAFEELIFSNLLARQVLPA